MQPVKPVSVAAVAVLFHPAPDAVEALYRSVRPQVDALWFVDNTPFGQQENKVTAQAMSAWDAHYRAFEENRGIAAAQNLGIGEAIAAGFTHVLLLDQDTLLASGVIQGLLAAEHLLLNLGVDVAAVGPVFIDRKTELPGKTHHHRWFRLSKPFVDLHSVSPIETDWLIASGSLIRSVVFQRSGLMLSDLFIDAVDTEWGLRARSLGLRSFVVPTVRINHSVGDSFIRLCGVSVIMHSERRNYYIARNWIYLLRLQSMGPHWRSGVLLRLAKFLLVHSWFTHNKGRMIRLFSRALHDGARGRLGPYVE